MRTILTAATGPPTILLTTALVVLVCFWLLVGVGVTTADSFDTDADLGLWGMGGVPVTVACSSLTVLSWCLSIGATALLDAFVAPGPAVGLLRLVAPVGALLVAWRLTCLFVRPLHRLFPDERDPSRLGGARTGECTALRNAQDESWDPFRDTLYDGALRRRDHAA